jgi:cell division protein ZapA (FtsZ GTPase activity inhibitor)
MQTTLRILGHDIALDCAPSEQRRLEDLAKGLEARLSGFTGDAAGIRRLVITALSLLDETQAAAAALARAHGEIERLNDMIAESRLDAAEGSIPSPDQGRLLTLRAQGVA